MFCPSCGAPNNERDQRYCRECGAPLPATGPTARAVASRPSQSDLPAAPPRAGGRSSALMSAGMKNKAVMGAIGVVVVVVVAYLVIKAIVGILFTLLLPLLIVVVVGALGYAYLKSKRRR